MQEKISMDAAHDFEAKMPLSRKIPLGLQHVFAMFVGNLTPLLIIMGACGIAGGEFADLQVSVLQNAMFVAGVVTLVQLFSIGPIGGKVPIIMGTSSGFIGVFNSVAATMGGGVIAYGAIMGASILGGLFETVLGFFLKPLRKFFPAVVTGTVVLSIGLSLIAVGINSFGGGTSATDFGSMEICCWRCSCWWLFWSSSTAARAFLARLRFLWALLEATLRQSSWVWFCRPPQLTRTV